MVATLVLLTLHGTVSFVGTGRCVVRRQALSCNWSVRLAAALALRMSGVVGWLLCCTLCSCLPHTKWCVLGCVKMAVCSLVTAIYTVWLPTPGQQCASCGQPRACAACVGMYTPMVKTCVDWSVEHSGVAAA